MQMLQTNALQTQQENNEPFEDYSLFVYRMTAPDFKERVKQLENKLLYPVREMNNIVHVVFLKCSTCFKTTLIVLLFSLNNFAKQIVC